MPSIRAINIINVSLEFFKLNHFHFDNTKNFLKFEKLSNFMLKSVTDTKELFSKSDVLKQAKDGENNEFTAKIFLQKIHAEDS